MHEAHPRAVIRDDGTTLAATGIIAYITETMGHELVGHGGVCLASGGVVTALAPLWMRCSIVTPRMVLAGPLFNFVAAAIAGAILMRLRRPGTFAYLLWLVFVFNLLVASGYLVVGGAIRFGDWNDLFTGVLPAWLWRIGAVAAGVIGYMLGLRATAALYARIAGPARDDRRLFQRRVLLSMGAAAIVAVAAEMVGGRFAPLALALPVACTLVVGWSVGATDPGQANTAQSESFDVRTNRSLQMLALALAIVFICVIGPAPGTG